MPSATLQVTIGSGATRATTASIPCRQIIVQNNADHAVRVGDVNVSSSRGIYLASGPGGGSTTFSSASYLNIDLNELWVAGTASDVVDFWYSY